MLDQMLLSAGSAGASSTTLYVEDVFSTYLYTGNNTARSITNGIDLAGSGGMVWIKSRTFNDPHVLFDTARGVNLPLSSNTSGSQTSGFTDLLTGFASTGFNLGADASTIAYVNGTGYNFASWTFRKAPKFFDVVTYTGTGANRTIAHNLGVVPGCILVKRTDTTADWQIYHRSNANTEYMVLNTNAAKVTGATRWNSTTPTATEFTVGTDATVNASGGTYVAYLFAHDATSNGIIQCGSFTSNSSGAGSATLGWEPQWVLMKNAGSTGNWLLGDDMRAMTANNISNSLIPQTNAVENNQTNLFGVAATGFSGVTLAPNATYTYIAIRRPMKTPTLGTSVFAPVAVTSSTTGSTRTFGFASDLIIGGQTDSNNTASNWFWIDRLRGFSASTDNTTGNAAQKKLLSSSSAAETTNTIPTNPYLYNIWNLSALQGTGAGYIGNGGNLIYYAMRRAPGFFDEVCYTGTSANRTLNHNLGVVPELMIVKRRNASGAWPVYSANLANTEYLVLNTTAAKATSATHWNSTTPSATTFTVGTDVSVNTSSVTYVAYLFASCPGVSKIGSYTGNGSSQTINCGFAAGARFVLIKGASGGGNWYVWDTTRGIVSGNDPHLSLNTVDAQVATNDTIDPDSSGFIVNQVTATNVNVAAATYIYLAIA